MGMVKLPCQFEVSLSTEPLIRIRDKTFRMKLFKVAMLILNILKSCFLKNLIPFMQQAFRGTAHLMSLLSWGGPEDESNSMLSYPL